VLHFNKVRYVPRNRNGLCLAVTVIHDYPHLSRVDMWMDVPLDKRAPVATLFWLFCEFS